MLGSLINFIYVLLLQSLRLYSFIWLIWIVLSWLTAFGAIRLDPYNPLVNFLYKITDGVVAKVFGDFRYKMQIGMIDLSPLVFLLILQFVVPTLLRIVFSFIIRALY